MDPLDEFLDRVYRGVGGSRELRLHLRQELREHLLDAAPNTRRPASPRRTPSPKPSPTSAARTTSARNSKRPTDTACYPSSSTRPCSGRRTP
jgi:hypothetical protein